MPAPGPADDRIIETSAPRAAMPMRVLRMLLLGCVVAACFGSQPLLAAANALPDGPVCAALRATASGWHQVMERVGAPVPYQRLRAALRAFEAWHAPA